MGTRLNCLNEAALTCTHNICFEQNYENSKKNQLKIVIFTAVKNRCILHGRVFVMCNLLHANLFNSKEIIIASC